jgi:hypothetical protein
MLLIHICCRMNGTIIDLFDLQNDLGGQSCKNTLFLEKFSRTNRYLYIFVVKWAEIQVMRFQKIIDLFDLQNDLGGQSCKNTLLLEKLVEQTISYTYLT